MTNIEIAEAIEKILDENHVWSEISDYTSCPMDGTKISVDIRGDWKHDHIRATYLIKEFAEKNNLNVFNYGEDVLEEDGSDYYTARHTYWIVPESAVEMLTQLRSIFA